MVKSDRHHSSVANVVLVLRPASVLAAFYAFSASNYLTAHSAPLFAAATVLFGAHVVHAMDDALSLAASSCCSSAWSCVRPYAVATAADSFRCP